MSGRFDESMVVIQCLVGTVRVPTATSLGW